MSGRLHAEVNAVPGGIGSMLVRTIATPETEIAMATVEKRSISLTSELATLVDEAVASGEFGNASEMIREALRQWKDRRDLHGYTVEELRLLWHEGLAGERARPLSDSVPSIIKQKGRERLSSRD